MAAMPTDVPEFLLPSRFRAYREYCRMEPTADAVLEDAARRIVDDPALLRLVWHCYHWLYTYPDGDRLPDWPRFDGVLGDAPCAPHLLVAVGMVPMVREVQKRAGVPEHITRDTCLEVQCFADSFRDAYGGQWGLFPQHLNWLRHYVAGRLHRVGRFEFMIRPFPGSLEAYRHRGTRQVVALADGGLRFNFEGQRPIEGIESTNVGVFETTFERADDAATGYLMSPSGMATDQRVTLRADTWERVLAEGDLTLDMHIPSGGRMTPERCAESLRGAVEFFARYYPDRPCVGISCRSWIYNTQLEEMLGAEANLVKHLRELYLYPIRSGGRDGLWFLFYDDGIDPRTARRDSSVRRAVLDHLLAGNHLRCGGMFILNEDLEHYGTQHYRSHWPPGCLD